MKRWFFILIIVATIILPGQAFATGGPQVVNRDGKISISADHITLGSLLSLWDKATGTKSTAPPELAGRKLSVHFNGLSENDAVRAIFLGQPFEYAFVQGQGIVVTSPSRVAEAQPNPPPVAVPPDVGAMQAAPEMQIPEIQRMKPQYVPPGEPLTITPSPFGAIVRPEGTEPPLVQLPPVPGAPLPPPFFRPDVPGYTTPGSPGLPSYTPFGVPYGPGPGHNMLYDPFSVLP